MGRQEVVHQSNELGRWRAKDIYIVRLQGKVLSISDWIKLLSGIIIVVVSGLIGWIMRHSQRLTAVEAKLNSLGHTIDMDRTHFESRMTMDYARLEKRIDALVIQNTRIEDKIDRLYNCVLSERMK